MGGGVMFPCLMFFQVFKGYSAGLNSIRLFFYYGKLHSHKYNSNVAVIMAGTAQVFSGNICINQIKLENTMAILLSLFNAWLNYSGVECNFAAL